MNCNYDVLFDKVGLGKLNKQVEATLEVLTDLPFCKTVITRKVVDVIPTDPADTPVNSFNQFDVNKIEVYVCKNKQNEIDVYTSKIAEKMSNSLIIPIRGWNDVNNTLKYLRVM